MPSTVQFTSGQPQFIDARARQLVSEGRIGDAWAVACQGRNLQDVLRDVGGSFAIVLTDDHGRTCMAVDRFGVQTLCYRHDGQTLRWSARADDLAEADSGIDAQALFDYLYFHVIPSPRTIFRAVRRLPAGHCAVLEGGSLTVSRWWRPRFDEQPGLDFAQARDRFRQALSEAVARTRDASRPACFLSGGTDSSTVAGMLAGLGGPKPDTYSIGFDAQGYDEMEYARLAARHFGTTHHEYYVTPQDLVDGIPRLAAHLDQPFGNSSCLPAWCCARMAREDGVTRLLAGDGGDELYGGNARYAKQQLFSHYARVPAAVRSLLVEPAVRLPLLKNTRLFRKAESYIEQARLPMPDRLQLYNLVMRLGPASVLSPAVLEQAGADASLALQREVWASAEAPCSELNRELAYDWRFTLAESDLPKVNAACGLAGVGVAYPMLDDALLELSLILPSDWKLRGQHLRWFFKEALRGFLPDEIIEKKKHGFGLPFGVWAQRHEGLKALATDSLHALAERGVVRRDFIEPLLRQRLAEHPGYYGELVWILMMLEQWLRAKAPNWRVA
jgi:asparagine synthase (glutamine-hydrolysing)